VGQASRRGAAARAARRQRPQLLEFLSENVAFLKASAQSYDNGFEAEAKRLAVVLRVLLHDTSASSSVLNQLGEKENLNFVDTALYIDPRNLVPTNTGLVMMRAAAGVGGKYVAPLGDSPPSRVRAPQLFRPWWENDPDA
jgi:hypothetical protein